MNPTAPSLASALAAWLLAASLSSPACQSQPPSEPAGEGCLYRDVPGTCLVESITPSGPNTYGEGFRTLISFQPDSNREASRKGVRMLVGDGKDPTSRYLARNRIEQGARLRCIRRVRIQGPCSPEAFVFPGVEPAY